MTNDSPDLAEAARCALECVCSGQQPESASRYYRSDFVDHVNDFELRGLEGVRRSVELYTSVLDELEVRVEEQLVDGDRVTSRFVVTGTHRGRRVQFNGITISRFGVMTKNERGKTWVSKVTLDPRIEWIERTPTAEELDELHHAAHDDCFIASSVKTEIVVAKTR